MYNIVTKKEIEACGFTIENNIIKRIDINICAHFGNTVSLVVMGKDVHLIDGYNNTGNLGYVIKNLIEFFELDEEDGVYLSTIRNIPCRIVLKQNMIVGFGHFMKDQFVLTSNFLGGCNDA